MSKLNREEIIKALECCGQPVSNCNECRYEGGNMLVNCDVDLMQKALALIKELTEENERLRGDVAKEFTCVFGQPHKVSDCPINDEIAKAKADTVNEIKTRVALRYGTYTDKDVTPIAEVFWLLDQIAKEMLEGI